MIALAILSAVLVVFVLFGLCLCLGAVSSRADAMATHIFEDLTAESDGDAVEPGTIVLAQFPVHRPSYGHRVEGLERLDGRRIALREPRPSNPGLN